MTTPSVRWSSGAIGHASTSGIENGKDSAMLIWNDVLRLAKEGNLPPHKKVEKTPQQWREQLTAEQFHITREKGTEGAFSSDSCTLFEPGAYGCICCEQPLFDATEKFDSGSGWPSFTQPTAENAIAYHNDGGFGMARIEVTCSACDGHLGHVFPDGPGPSGLRYCINALSMKKF